VKALPPGRARSYNHTLGEFTDRVPAPRLEVAMNIITAFVREQERSRVEAAAAQLGLSVSISSQATDPTAQHTTGVWRGSRYAQSAPVLRLEIPYWGFRVEDAAEEILRAASPDGPNGPPATVWVTSASWFGTSCATPAALPGRESHPAYSTTS
jgi:hypothetical protein